MQIRRWVAVLMGLALIAPLASAGEKSTPQWFEKIKLKGDLRLRYEGFQHEGKFDDGRRDRFRLRYRFGFIAKVTDVITVGSELRSGDRLDPVSDNQSLDEGFSKKEVAFAQMYADFKLSERFSLIAGKFSPKKLWHVSDMHIDDDVVTEGAMGRWSFGGNGGAIKAVHANLFVYALEESSSGSDAYAYGGQIYPVFASGKVNEFLVGLGYETYSNPDVMAQLTVDKKIKGNKMTHFVDENGNLISDFDILSAFFQWKNKSNKQWPVKVSAFYYDNTGAKGPGKDNDTAYFVRLQVGDYKKPGQMAFRLSRYYSEPDAIFYAWTQSDTTRGSNLDGYRFDYRVGLHSGGYLNFTWYHTDSEVTAFGAPDKAPLYASLSNFDDQTMDRWQVDYILKF